MLLQIYRICIEIPPPPQMKITDSSKLIYWVLCNCCIYVRVVSKMLLTERHFQAGFMRKMYQLAPAYILP